MKKKSLTDSILERMRTGKGRIGRRILVGITAFATAYSLITPASTLNAEEAEENGLLPEKTNEVTEEATVEKPVSAEEETPVVEETPQEEETVVEEQQEVSEEQAPAETQEETAEPVADSGEEAPVPEKTEYVYEEEGVLKVTATLSDPAAVPDEAELVVTPVTADLDTYNYDAYLEALNNSSEKEYTSENTLFYDVAFMLDGVEIQPDADKVTVTFDFLQNQLSADLNAEVEANVEIKHLPLTDEVKEQVGTTGDAVNITADDIIVEDVAEETVDLNAETVEFKTDSFSVFAVNYTVDFTYDGYTFSIAGTESILLSDLFTALGIDADAAQAVEVEFTNPELVAMEQQENDWLLTSLKAFSTNETLTVTMTDGIKYVIDVTDAQDALELSIGMYDYDDATAISFPSDWADDKIYAFVWSGDDDFSHTNIPDNTPWAIVELNDIEGHSSPYAVNFGSFNNQPWGGGDVAYSSLTQDQKNNLHVRIIHSNENNAKSLGGLKNMSQHQSSLFEEVWNGGFDGYALSANHNSGLEAGTGTYEVGFMKGNTLEHDVVLEFNPASDKGAIPGGKSYVMLDATSADGNNHYYYVVEAVTDGSTDKVYLPITGNWSSNQPFSNNWRNITAKVITPTNGATIQTGGVKPENDSYKETYVMGDYLYNYKGRKSETDSSAHIQRDEFVFELKKPNYEPAIDPYDVLGEGAEYGVVANEYERKNHTETNFAVNKYIENTDSGIDLAANAGQSNMMPFYIGEYNNIKFTGNTTVNPDIYTPSSKTDPYVHSNSEDEAEDHIHQDGTGYDVTVYPTSQSDVKTYVDGLIDKLTSSSQTYANKSMIKAEPGKVLDTTSLPDNITIYVDATDLNISEAGWEIKKLEGQSIVLNIPGDNVHISKEYMSVYKKNEDGSLEPIVENLNSNTDGNGGDPVHNKNVEDHILNHLVLNAYEATSVTFTDGPAGLFLAPNADFEEQNGSGTGWVATGKKFTQTGSEWHFFRKQRKYKANGGVVIQLLKTVNGKDPTDTSSSRDFVFEIYPLDSANPKEENNWHYIDIDGDGVIESVAEATSVNGGLTTFAAQKLTNQEFERQGTPTYNDTDILVSNNGDIHLRKILNTEHELENDAQFTYTISSLTDGAPMPATTSFTSTKADADQLKSFGSVSFTQARTYKYSVKEKKTVGSSTIYEADYLVTIVVTEDGSGNLVVQESNSQVEISTIKMAFKVAELIPEDAEATINGTKVKYKDATQEQKDDPNNEFVDSSTGITYKVSEQKLVEITAAHAKPNQASEGIISFTVLVDNEQLPDSSKIVSEDGKTTTIDIGPYVNTYSASGEGEIKVKKDYSETYPEEGFTFTLAAGKHIQKKDSLSRWQPERIQQEKE